MADPLSGQDAVTLAEQADTAYPLVPRVDDPSPPEDAAFDLVDDVSDFAADSLPDTLEQDLEGSTLHGEDFAFDWVSGELFVGDSGDPLRVGGEDAVLEQIQRRIYTPKGEFAIYSDDFGSDLDKVIGTSLPTEVQFAEIERALRECVLAHSRVTDCQVIGISPVTGTVSDGSYMASLEITIDNDQTPVQLDLTI